MAIIKAKSGTLTLGASGQTITVPNGVAMTGHNYPAFKVMLSANQSVATGTWVKINWNTATWNIGSAWNTSTYKFTVPSNLGGKYQFDYKVFYDDLDDGEYGGARLYKNGTELAETYSQIFSGKATGNMYLQCTENLDLVAGDEIEFYVVHNEAAAINIRYESSFFQGHRLGD